MPKYPSPEEIEVIYAKRDADIARLRGQTTIEVADLEAIDRLGRFQVCCDLWAKCSESARQRLRNDAHHFVRSAAVLAD